MFVCMYALIFIYFFGSKVTVCMYVDDVDDGADTGGGDGGYYYNYNYQSDVPREIKNDVKKEQPRPEYGSSSSSSYYYVDIGNKMLLSV